jgi:hypothetical protein
MLPAFFEQLDAASRARVCRAGLVIELEAEAGTIGQGEAPIARINARRFVHQVQDP